MAANGQWLLFPSSCPKEKSGRLPDDDAVSLVVSNANIEITIVDPSTVASSLQRIKELYHSEEKVAPLCDYIAETINCMGRQHMERTTLEDLMKKQL